MFILSLQAKFFDFFCIAETAQYLILTMNFLTKIQKQKLPPNRALLIACLALIHF
jgi:hypothetical protein